MNNNCMMPGQTMLDTEGKRIQAHGGGMFYENGTYFWYGENKEYSTGKKHIWTWGIRCYSSIDLYNWKDEGLIIPPNMDDKTSSLHPSKPVDRPHILKNSKTGKYVCWLKLSGKEAYFTVLTADSILGPYTIVTDHLKPFGKDAGDFDLWQNEQGEGFIFFEHDHNGVIAARLTSDFLNVSEPYRDMFVGLKPPFTREGVTHFTHRGRHYLLTSGMTGYIPNPSEVAVSDDPLGPYAPMGNPHRNDDSSASFNSQVSYVFQAPHWKDLYLVLADRWVPNYVVTDKKYQQILRVVAHQSDKSYKPKLSDYLTVAGAPFLGTANTSIAEYVWLPMYFEDEKPVIEWHEKWTVEEYNHREGTQ
ncbi:MAG: family 43 glycosylhydrolase [Lachnospiraceae bacterium]|nr:family 43 glycosylhydrolase [Lachnospiraceae bacterium]